MNSHLRSRGVILILSAGLAGVSASFVHATRSQSARAEPASGGGSVLRDAHRSFYNGRYVEAAAQAFAVRGARSEDLAGYELRSSALLFQLKRALPPKKKADKKAAFKACEQCPDWLAAFTTDTAEGLAVARARLAADPMDEEALFYLAKLDLNYVWLELELLGHKKGWSQYWEARRSLDALLERNPQHVRARVARAWIDYIVDTKLPRGTRWLLGGGNRKHAIVAMRKAADAEADFFVETEADFGLWDMEARERNFPEAVAVARRLLRDFPENRDIVQFLAVHDPAGSAAASDTPN